MMSELSQRFGLDRCLECGTCSEACPSSRNGGVDPENVVECVSNGGEVIDVWKCLQCHRCTMVCPQGIDVSCLIVVLRNISSSKGEAPERFVRTAQQVFRTGKTVPSTGRTESQRSELGLDASKLSDGAIDDLRIKMKGMGGII